MQRVLDELHLNMQQVKGLHALYRIMKKRTTSVLDITDLLRTQLVLSVSALDRYVHEIVRIGMLEVHAGNRSSTPPYQKFQIGLCNISAVATNPSNNAWLDLEIRNRHGLLSFQRPDKIADAIRLVSSVPLWDSVALRMGVPAADLKTHIELIADRRNKIAHEFDVDPSTPGARWPIDEALVDGAIAFVEQLCESIHAVVV